MPTTPAPGTSAPAPARKAAKAAGLVYVSDVEPGIARRKAGKGFSYRLPAGRPVRDARTIARIRSLAIPPAYVDVWICASERGHIQATGRDARNRKQYRYHPDWSAVRGDGKFERIVAFGEALPRLRRRLRRDLALSGWPREKVVAIVVALMAETLVRIGNDAYARENRSYGLTTLRDRHVQFLGGGRARLKFRGKGGLDHDIAIDDARLAKLVRGCQQLPGQMLFQYRDDAGKLQPVGSGLVNDYLREAMGEDFTAKDFRTWGGTLLAAEFLAEAGVADTEREARRMLVDCVKHVAEDLGNTPAVTRGSYICPVIFDRYLEGKVLDDYEPRAGRLPAELEGLSRSEAALKRLLESEKALKRGRGKGAKKAGGEGAG